jgi:hypothetical protein
MATNDTNGANSVSEEGYQGWTNHETWATYLWLGNTESYYRELRRCTTIESLKSLVNRIVESAINGTGTQDDSGMVYDIAGSAIPADRNDGMREVSDRLGAWYAGTASLRRRDEYKRFVRGLVNQSLEQVNWQEMLEAATEE